MEENKSKSTTILVFVLVLIIVLLAGFICYDKFINKSTNKEETQEKEETKATEEEVTDVNLIRELSNKVDALVAQGKFYVYNDKSDAKISNTYGIDYLGKVLKNDFTNQQKEKIVLNSLQFGETKKINETDNELLKTYIGWDYQELKKEEYNSRSIDLFGKVIENEGSIENFPHYIYDSNLKVYYQINGGGGFSANNYINGYKSKFTLKDDFAYVYVNYAYIVIELGPNGKQKIYKDFSIDSPYTPNESDLYKTLDDDMQHNDIVTKDNYQDFVQYRYNFKKNSDGSYYFVNVEKVK